MTKRKWLLCGGLALAVPGLVGLAARQSRSQEMEGRGKPDERPAVRQPDVPGGPMEPQGFPAPGMPAMPGPLMGPGGFPPPPGAGTFPAAMGPPPDPEALAEARADSDRESNLRRRVDELSRKHRLAPAAEKGAVKESLRKALGELFDAKLSMQEHRAKRVAEDLSRVREMISKSKANREKIVGRRLEQLTDSEGWEW